MDCGHARIAISARLDGELTPAETAAIEEHVAACPACRAYASEAAALHRRVRLRAAEPAPDLTAGILAAIGSDQGAARTGSLRLGLALIGAIQVLMALPAFVFGEEAGLPSHTARHLGSFAVALGVGFLVVAWQPRRAAGLFPVMGVLVGCLFLSSAIDVGAGDARAASEIAGHATELVGLGLLWWLTADTGHARPWSGLRRLRGSGQP